MIRLVQLLTSLLLLRVDPLKKGMKLNVAKEECNCQEGKSKE